MDGSLPQSLKHIISNAEYYGPSLFLLGECFITFLFIIDVVSLNDELVKQLSRIFIIAVKTFRKTVLISCFQLGVCQL